MSKAEVDKYDENGVIKEGRLAGSHTRPNSVRPDYGPREIVWHRPVPPTVKEGPSYRDKDAVTEEHEAWGLVSASRVSCTPGAILFDSDVRHREVIRLSVNRASRDRDLNRDWIHPTGPDLIEIEMSEAQFGALVSSMNTQGVPCTIRATETNANVNGLAYEPRLKVSMDEVRASAEKVRERLDAAVAAVEDKPTKANIRALRIALEGTQPNLDFAAKSLAEHAENVVQRARADIESMVVQKAVQLGVDPQALAFTLEGESPVKMIDAGESPEDDSEEPGHGYWEAGDHD